MFGLSFWHLILLSAIGLIVLGPEQLPQVARVIGRTIAEIRKAMRDVTTGMSMDMEDEGRTHNARPTKPAIAKAPEALPPASSESANKKDPS